MHQKYISSSDLTSYLACPRKAVMQLRGLRGGSSKAQQRGTALHNAVEDYLRGKTGDRVLDSLGDFARQAGYLPAPNDPRIKVELGLGVPNSDAARYADVVEWSGQDVRIGDVPLRGMIDLLRVDRNMFEVIDHKTCSTFYYAETEDTLRGNVQLWMYAYLALTWAQRTGFADVRGNTVVRLAHIQYATGAKPSANAVREVEVLTTSTEVVARWNQLKQVARVMLDDTTRPLRAVIPRFDQCKAYGGCPFAAWCPLLALDTQAVNPNVVRAVEDWRLDS
jgi:hypothetical protein